MSRSWLFCSCASVQEHSRLSTYASGMNPSKLCCVVLCLVVLSCVVLSCVLLCCVVLCCVVLY